MNKQDAEFILRWAKKIKAIDVLGGECEVCGLSDIFVLNFHHVSEDKDFEINSKSNRRWSIIEKEIKKCILLCSNCHMMEHSSGGRISLEKKTLMEGMGFNKCVKCGFTNDDFSPLCFHHVDMKNKLFSLSDYYKNKGLVPMELLIKEMNKCEVLCRNCHTIEHINVNKFDLLKKDIFEKVDNYKEKRHKVNREEIMSMYNDGVRQVDIARHFGCAKSTINMALKNM